MTDHTNPRGDTDMSMTPEAPEPFPWEQAFTPTPDPEPVAAPVEPDPEVPARVLLDLLSLVVDEIPGGMPTAAEAVTWTREQRGEVAAWAGAHHLYASDNDVTIPPVPEVLAARVVDPEPAPEGPGPHPWDSPDLTPRQQVAEPVVDPEPAAVEVYEGLGLERIVEVLDELAADHARRSKLVGQATTAVQVAVRERADARRDTRRVKLDGKEPKTPTDLRAELVGAANDAEVLADLAAVFTAGATEAKGIAGDLLAELPKRGGKARASAKVADGEGFELSVVVSKRSETKVDHAAVDEILAAQVLADVQAAHEADPTTGPLALGQLPAKTYAAGVRAGIAALRYVLSTSPTYRSTALAAVGKRLENAGEDDLASRLAAAYGKVERGEPSTKLERKPLAAETSTAPASDEAGE